MNARPLSLSALFPVAVVLAALALFFTGCAATKTKPEPTKVCQAAPQWVTTDEQGAPSKGLYACFDSDGFVRYESRALTLDQLAALTAKPTPAAVPIPEAKVAKPAPKTTKLAHRSFKQDYPAGGGGEEYLEKFSTDDGHEYYLLHNRLIEKSPLKAERP